MIFERNIKYFVLLLVAVFPIVTASVKDAGSGIYILLCLLGLFLGWSNWKLLSTTEKNWLLGFLVFVALASLSLINTDDWHNAGKKLERFLRFLAMIPIYLLFRRLQTSTVQAFLVGSAIGCVVLGLQAWVAVADGATVVHGVYHKIVFGDTAMLLVVIVAMGLLTVAHRWWHFVVGFICIVFGLYASLMSMTRGAWIVIPLLIPFLLFLYHRVLQPRQWLMVAGVLLAVLVVGSQWLPQSIITGVNTGIAELKKFKENPSPNSSWGARLNMWEDSITLWREHPIIGVGIGDFKLEREKLMDQGLARQGYGYGHAHSIYFHALATTGVIGLLALITFLWILPGWGFYQVWAQWQHQQWARFSILAGMVSLVTFAIFGLTEGWTARNPFLNAFGMCMVVFLSSMQFYRDTSDQQEPQHES